MSAQHDIVRSGECQQLMRCLKTQNLAIFRLQSVGESNMQNWVFKKHAESHANAKSPLD